MSSGFRPDHPVAPCCGRRVPVVTSVPTLLCVACAEATYQALLGWTSLRRRTDEACGAAPPRIIPRALKTPEAWALAVHAEGDLSRLERVG